MILAMKTATVDDDNDSVCDAMYFYANVFTMLMIIKLVFEKTWCYMLC